MPSSDATPVTIAVSATLRVSGLLQGAQESRVCLVLAHGAGAGMTHPLARCGRGGASGALKDRDLALPIPYMEQGGKRPDPPKLAHATVRAAVAEAARLLPQMPLFAGGRAPFRRAQADPRRLRRSSLPGIRGLIFLGFPLHPAGKPSRERAKHLLDVEIPMLFLQGTRDALAMLDELEPVCEALGVRATLRLFADADHSFHVPARTGRKDAQVRAEMLDALAAWIEEVFPAADRRRPPRRKCRELPGAGSTPQAWPRSSAAEIGALEHSKTMPSAPKTFPLLSTPRLTLRAPTQSDAEAFRALLAVPDVTRFSNWPDAPSKPQGERFMRWMAKHYASGKGCAWIIADRGSSALLGAIRFNRFDKKWKGGEIGYELHPDHWGKGLMSEAVRGGRHLAATKASGSTASRRGRFRATRHRTACSRRRDFAMRGRCGKKSGGSRAPIKISECSDALPAIARIRPRPSEPEGSPL